jgi:hypothetical protein
MSDDLDELTKAEQRGYANAMEAERKLHEDRIEQLEREWDEARHLQSCACNYDTPTDVCMGHHALFERLYAAKRGKLEAKLAKALDLAVYAVNALDEIQTYKQPDDPWTENALTMRELDAFDFNVEIARATLKDLGVDMV